jgi:hypothetical protein
LGSVASYATQRTPGTPTRSGRGALFRPLRDRRTGGADRPQLHTSSASVLSTIVGSALSAGLGILIAYTSDGGALSITTYDGDDRDRTYCASPEELEQVAEVLLDVASSRELAHAAATARTKAQ